MKSIFRTALTFIASAALLPLLGQAQTAKPETKSESAAPSATAGPFKPGAKLTYSSVHVDGPYIALTFDDGPHVTNTPRLLDMLAQRHIHVTFFVVGECAHKYPDLLKRELAEGHEIGNHSWSHPVLSKMSDEKVKAELQKTQDAIVQATGYTPKLFRPPYGAITERQKKWINEQFGYKCILWAVDPFDWKRPGPAVVAHRIISETRPGAIILSHDIHKGTIDAMTEVLDTLQAKGYKFVTVSELLALEKPKTASAKASATSAAVAAPAAGQSAVPTPKVEVKPAPAGTPKKNDLPDSL